jgi:hypothetical protein
MITRNRITFSEKQAALLWQQVVRKELSSTKDEPLSVIYPGRTSGDNGPDFRDAVIAIESHWMNGDVEVHVKSSDWYGHRHHADPEYNNVILHVVLWYDCNCPTLLQNGKLVPVLSLAKALRHQPYLLPDQLPCFQILNRIDEQTVGKILNTAGEERFKQKAAHFQAQILDDAPRTPGIREAAGQVLYRGMMRALGYAKNTKPFEELADRMSLPFIESRKGLVLKQALLLGTAGLLPSQRRQGESGNREEVRELEQIWQSADRKTQTMKENDWNLSHIYPNNSPVRRIIAQSYLLERYSEEKLLSGVLQLVKEAHSPNGRHVFENGLTVAGDGYWQDHFDFDVRSKTKISALLGHSKAGEIIVNVVLPFAFSWAELTADAKLTENAMDLCRNYPRLADNCITRHMLAQLCLEEFSDLTACHQQGLIHIFRNYCREGKCAECPLGS